MICFIHMFGLLNSFYHWKWKIRSEKQSKDNVPVVFMLSKLFTSQLKLYSMPRQNTGKKCIFLNVFSRGKHVFVAIIILFQVSEVISRHFVYKLVFSKEQNKEAFEDRFNNPEKNKCYLFCQISSFALYQYYFLHHCENIWCKTW